MRFLAFILAMLAIPAFAEIKEFEWNGFDVLVYTEEDITQCEDVGGEVNWVQIRADSGMPFMVTSGMTNDPILGPIIFRTYANGPTPTTATEYIVMGHAFEAGLLCVLSEASKPE